ncbi:MAG TPA: dihydroneopterin aldolase [Methylomirabilota bacterium]|nr:dihydroneopterin aldolase [Methylomirabilota bacterium]
MSSDKVFLEDVRFYGHHGVTKAQQTVGAWFSVDVELSVDLAAAATSDDLRTTVDYGLVAARIVEECTKERVNLLERLAGRLAGILLGEFPCTEVRVRVRKLTPPMEGLQGIPGVELVRRRGSSS